MTRDATRAHALASSTAEHTEHLARGSAAYERGAYAEAERALSEAVLLEPRSSTTHFLFGCVTFKKTGLLDRAPDPARAPRVRDGGRSARELGEAWPGWRGRRRRLSDLAAATSAVRRCLALDPANADAWFLLYTLLSEEDEHDAMLDALEGVPAR